MAHGAVLEPTAVLVVRAWRHGQPAQLAARITYTVDVTRTDEVTVTATGVDEIVAAVERWLEDVSRPRPPGDVPVTQA